MGIEAALIIKPYECARNDIECWRGICLDFFAKGERLIGQTLEIIKSDPKFGSGVKLRHLAGQRSDDLTKLIPDIKLGKNQFKAVSASLTKWRELEERRNQLAHSTLTVTLDAHDGWFAIFDMSAYRVGELESCRWALSKIEAKQFSACLETSWKSLSGQLGQVRKKMGEV